jgi:sugar phosphate isomerase/epimerase
LSESLKKVADIGYTTVQLSGVCAYEPEWMNEELKKNGLECVLTHWKADEILEDPVSVINKHRTFGCENIGLGCMPGGWATEEMTHSFIKNFKEPAKIIAQNGAKLFFHNHHWEFARSRTGERFLERFLADFPPELLSITLDTYWVQYGGASPEEILRALAGRAECVHLKDLAIVGGKQRMAVLGEGNLNFPKIIAAAEDAGTEHLLVEQDDCYGEDPFECLARSYRYLRALGLE